MTDRRPLDVLFRYGPVALMVVVGLVLPLTTSDYWLGRILLWIPLAIAALGLNLLTGFNGQISVGHFAFYGVGAYTCGLLVAKWDWPMGLAVLAAVVVCFVVGVVVGLPALRIKGLYLALVTLAVAVLFPDLVKHFESVTGGSSGLYITTPEMNSRGVVVERSIQILAPEGIDLSTEQWTFYLYLAVAIVAFIVVRNIVHSRVGRSMIAIRDNEVAAEVNGVNVAAVKVFTFGLSSALAGLGGAMFALWEAQLFPQSFTLGFSLVLLVAVVVGGPASVLGPALGAIFVGVFEDMIKPELPDELSAVTPLILGLSLVGLMLVAPGGIAGMARQLAARVQRSRPPAGPAKPSGDPISTQPSTT
ncbi:MAG: branched-chain amino acid ABC transporter permease [Microthrixaceae bacterium]|nr:branched-chain amino acid ABC transporter permease [Microthrixaceae bacterium]